MATWPIIVRADSSRAPQFAAREDQTEGSARTLLVGAGVASLLGAGHALRLAEQHRGAPRALLIGAAVLTVVLSWTLVNTVYTLRYAHQYFRSKPGGIAFGTEDGQQQPGYRDFACVAFTIGMTYQVSDTTLRDPHRSGVACSPTPSCRICSAWSSSRARSTSSPDCSASSARPTAANRPSYKRRRAGTLPRGRVTLSR